MSEADVYRRLQSPESGLAGVAADSTGFDHRALRHADLLTLVSVTASLAGLVQFANWIYELIREGRKSDEPPAPRVTVVLQNVELTFTAENRDEILAELERAIGD